MTAKRWSIEERKTSLGVDRVFYVRKGWDDATVHLAFGSVFCQDCTAPLAHELTSCRHALAVRRALASGRSISAGEQTNAAKRDDVAPLSALRERSE